MVTDIMERGVSPFPQMQGRRCPGEVTHSAPVVKIMKVSLSRSLIRLGVTCRRSTSRRLGTKSTPSTSSCERNAVKCQRLT